MNLTSSAETITCAYPGCSTITKRTDSTYVDGCGDICPGCDEARSGPAPEWWGKIEPPF
jgi:hypothetical protein